MLPTFDETWKAAHIFEHVTDGYTYDLVQEDDDGYIKYLWIRFKNGFRGKYYRITYEKLKEVLNDE